MFGIFSGRARRPYLGAPLPYQNLRPSPYSNSTSAAAAGRRQGLASVTIGEVNNSKPPSTSAASPLSNKLSWGSTLSTGERTEQTVVQQRKEVETRMEVTSRTIGTGDAAWVVLDGSVGENEGNRDNAKEMQQPEAGKSGEEDNVFKASQEKMMFSPQISSWSDTGSERFSETPAETSSSPSCALIAASELSDEPKVSPQPSYVQLSSASRTRRKDKSVLTGDEWEVQSLSTQSSDHSSLASWEVQSLLTQSSDHSSLASRERVEFASPHMRASPCNTPSSSRVRTYSRLPRTQASLRSRPLPVISGLTDAVRYHDGMLKEQRRKRAGVPGAKATLRPSLGGLTGTLDKGWPSLPVDSYNIPSHTPEMSRGGLSLRPSNNTSVNPPPTSPRVKEWLRKSTNRLPLSPFAQDPSCWGAASSANARSGSAGTEGDGVGNEPPVTGSWGKKRRRQPDWEELERLITNTIQDPPFMPSPLQSRGPVAMAVTMALASPLSSSSNTNKVLLKDTGPNTMSGSHSMDTLGPMGYSTADFPARTSREHEAKVTELPAPRTHDFCALMDTRLIDALSQVLSIPKRRKALEGLKGERAQLLVNFSHSVSLHAQPSPLDAHILTLPASQDTPLA